MSVNICIGMFTYNEERNISEAIESLLAQTYKNFRLIILDDCSTDNTQKIIQEYATKDGRILYLKNSERMGIAANYRITFNSAGDDVDYFAWAADHDVHHPKWLETLVKVLNKYPDVVMAYSLTVRISDEGRDLNIPSPIFDTFGLEIRDRIKAVCYDQVGAGNMIYGLFRADALRKAGIFPSVLLPDVLLLSELSLHGSYKQVNKPLWFRRYVGLFDIQRQKKNLFTKVPWYAHIPWPIVNATLLFFNTVFKSHKNDLKTRILGLNLTIRFFIRYLPTIKRDSKLIGKYVEKLIKIDWIRKRYLTILGHDDSDLFRDRKP